MTDQNKIEILSAGLLDKEHSLVNEFKSLSRSFGNYPIGWHYLLDFAWVFSQLELGDLKNKVALDAGAGTGLGQWYLAEKGAKIYSVDRTSRACLPFYFRKRYHVEGLRPKDFFTIAKVLNPLDQSAGFKEKARALVRSGRGLLARLPKGFATGKVIIYNQDLANLIDIPDNSVDFIVSISSLEHNTPDGLAAVVDELMRVLKPGGKLIATLGAAREHDWFHEPSQGWCYTDETLRILFKLSAQTPSNYIDYDDLLDSLKNCKELRDGVSASYKLNWKNGLPGGKWDLSYQPVGVVKIKQG